MRFLSKSYYAVVSLWLLVLPSTLCSDWSFDTIPLIHSVLDPRVLLIVGVVVVLGWLAWVAFKPKGESTAM